MLAPQLSYVPPYVATTQRSARQRKFERNGEEPCLFTRNRGMQHRREAYTKRIWKKTKKWRAPSGATNRGRSREPDEGAGGAVSF
jgi:hypothetical protein